MNLSRLADDIIHCGFHIGIGECRVAAFGRHGIFAIDYAFVEVFNAALNPWLPSGFVAELWRIGCTRHMAHRTVSFKHGLAGAGFYHCRRRLDGCVFEFHAGLVGHIPHGARHFIIRKLGIATARGHLADAVDCVFHQRGFAVLKARRPGFFVTDLGRV